MQISGSHIVVIKMNAALLLSTLNKVHLGILFCTNTGTQKLQHLPINETNETDCLLLSNLKYPLQKRCMCM